MDKSIKFLAAWVLCTLMSVVITLAAICKNLNERVIELEAIEAARWQGVIEAADTIELSNTLYNRCEVNRNAFRIMRQCDETR